jgi:cardiolipin synthase (CMP-forming)
MVPEITPGPKASAPRPISSPPASRRLELSLNLPNLITLARLLAVPAAIWFILNERHAAAFWVFVAAGLSDALDGYIAKRFNRSTELGALLDPAADKALLTGVYLTLGIVGHLPAWLVFLVILRDFLIVLGYIALRSSAAATNFGPLYISKINTLVQIALIGFVLARLGLGVEAGWETALLIAAATVTTVWSGLSYLARCARILAGTERAT